MNVKNNGSDFSSADRNVFASAEWANAYASNILPLAIGNESVTKAALNLFSYEKLGKTVLINPPFTRDCGLSFQFETDKTYSRISDVKHVMRFLMEYIKKNYANAYVDIAFPPSVVDIQPFIQEGFTPVISYTYRISLKPDEKKLLSDFSSERRKNIRDAGKADLKIEMNQNVEEILTLVRDTWHRAGLKFDAALLRKILEADLTFTLSVRSEGKMIAAAVIAMDKDCAYYVAGGTQKNTVNNGAGALVLWESMKMAKKLNRTMFDFCGSSVPSIEKFFRGFGGELTPYFRVRNNHKLFDILKSTKEKLSSL